MEKIVFNNETFYFDKCKLYDETFIEIPKNVSNKILGNYYSKIDYSAYDEAKLLKFIKELKVAEQYSLCIKAILYGLNNVATTFSFYTSVFPMLSSCYRAIGMPQSAIDFWMKHKRNFSSCLSVPLLTSLAAAYCDVGNYVLAKKCADRAYLLQNGGKGYNTELSAVYGRIRKESDLD